MCMSLDEDIGLFGKCSRTMDALWCDVMLIQGKYFDVSICRGVCFLLLLEFDYTLVRGVWTLPNSFKKLMFASWRGAGLL